MSKYTTELRFICENAAGYKDSQDYPNIESIINDSRNKIFDFSYPIFDDTYKPILEKKILRHYYTREIGLETVGLWKHFLNMRMNEIMPYYNKLYESELLNFNPLYDVDYSVDHKGKDVRDSSSYGISERNTNFSEDADVTRDASSSGIASDTNNGDKITKYSDTPQGGLTNLMEDRYLTNATQEVNSNTNNSENSNIQNETTDTTKSGNSNDRFNDSRIDNMNNTDEYINHVSGKQSGITYSKMLKEFRDTFLNIDMLIIRDLNDLFMGVW